MARVYLSIGSNLGDRRRNIETAIELLRDTGDIEVVKISTLYETDPIGGPPQDKFLNGALEIKTNLAPYDLLKSLNKIEEKLGRVRTIKHGPRTLDLDILTYDDITINEPDLVIPHPQMTLRDFVLKPLTEIAPEIFQNEGN